MTKRREKNKPQQPQLNKQLEPSDKVSVAQEKDELAISFGKFCLDLAKLTYGGVFLSAIMQLSYDMEKAVTIGAIAIILLAILGFIFIKIGNKKRN